MAPAQSPWDAALAAEPEHGYAGLRHGLDLIAKRDSEWAGIPMPMDNNPMVIDRKFPNAEKLMEIGLAKTEREEDPEFDGATVRNRFWSWNRRSDVSVIQLANGRITYGITPGVHHFRLDFDTLRASDAWGLATEARAMNLLATLVNGRQFRQYLLTGMFIESSAKSKLSYIFRRLKPTVAIGKTAIGDGTRILACLCLHPIAYYSGTWAGAMCPTDDVIAHLMLMRGDEPMFWRRANQHPAYRPEAGL